jgi:hypothetical protein
MSRCCVKRDCMMFRHCCRWARENFWPWPAPCHSGKRADALPVIGDDDVALAQNGDFCSEQEGADPAEQKCHDNNLWRLRERIYYYTVMST